MPPEKEIETKVIKASYVLQAKVGSGPLDAKKVRQSQHIIEGNKVDFAPLGMEFLKELEKALKKAKNENMSHKEMREALTPPIMQLKANAAMFKYTLVGSMANIMLNFLETIRTVDDEAYEIVEAHHKTLQAIIIKRMSGDGGMEGHALEKELKQACRRYFTKRKIPATGVFAVDMS